MIKENFFGAFSLFICIICASLFLWIGKTHYKEFSKDYGGNLKIFDESTRLCTESVDYLHKSSHMQGWSFSRVPTCSPNEAPIILSSPHHEPGLGDVIRKLNNSQLALHKSYNEIKILDKEHATKILAQNLAAFGAFGALGYGLIVFGAFGAGGQMNLNNPGRKMAYISATMIVGSMLSIILCYWIAPYFSKQAREDLSIGDLSFLTPALMAIAFAAGLAGDIVIRLIRKVISRYSDLSQ